MYSKTRIFSIFTSIYAYNRFAKAASKLGQDISGLFGLQNTSGLYFVQFLILRM